MTTDPGCGCFATLEPGSIDSAVDVMEKLENAIHDLQTRVAFQEATIDELSKTVAQQASELVVLNRKLRQLSELLHELSQPAGSEAAHEPPPHY